MSDSLIIQAVEPSVLILQAEDSRLVMGIAVPINGGDTSGANVGNGEEVFRDVSGGSLNFRTLASAGGVNLSTDGDEIDFQTHVSDVVSPDSSDDSYVVGTFWTNTTSGDSFILSDNTLGSAVWDPISGAVPSVPWNKDSFSSSPGQITFILSQAPTDPNSLVLDVNGAAYEGGGLDYTISGVTITWLNTQFAMELNDRVIVHYK